MGLQSVWMAALQSGLAPRWLDTNDNCPAFQKAAGAGFRKLGIPRGGLDSMRHGAASARLADGATPAMVQKRLRHSDPRITLSVYAHVIGDQRYAVEHRSARIEEFAVKVGSIG
jgi:integrase